MKKIAIGCQGGGSHTAFTAGVLSKLLRALPNEYRIIGLSGTSGGAICALIAWHALLRKDAELGARQLHSFWQSNSATTLPDAVINFWLVAANRLQSGLPEVSPYFLPQDGLTVLRAMIEDHVPFDQIPALLSAGSPALYIGAVDVLSGKFEVFKGDGIRVEHILASAAVPNLFRAVRVGGSLYWDGLFSQNPPIREFLCVPENAAQKPDEIWIIQINPPAVEKEPRLVQEIEDRRNELSGNLSLTQERDFIDQVNKWLEKGWLPAARFKPVAVRTIRLESELDAASKLDRRPAFIAQLIGEGEAAATQFLGAL